MTNTASHAPSLWADLSGAEMQSPTLEDTRTCDALVIGAGFTGLRAALSLAEAGSSVVVLDAGDVGWGASGRNGGQVNPMLPVNGPAHLEKLVGATFADRLTEASLGSADALFSFIQDYQIECGARQNGWLRVDHCAKAAATSQANVAGWIKHGADMQIVEGDDLRKLTGSDAYDSGVLTTRGGAVQPLALAKGIARVARAAGAKIYGQSEVTKLTRKDSLWEAATPNGSVRAPWVILATNGYSGSLLPGLKQSFLPVTPIQIATDPLPDAQIEAILPGGQTISDTRRVIMYARREPDNRMVFGGHGRVHADGSISGHDWLMKDAARIFPQIKRDDWVYRWGGHIAVTQDRLPHLHEPEKGLIAGFGYNGRGVAMSQIMGQTMAARVLGADPSTLVFPTTKLRNMPFRRIQMMGKSTAVRWWKLRDAWEAGRVS